MLKYVFGLEDYEKDDPLMFCAEDQCWDKETLKELKEKYNVIFESRGVHAIMVLNKDSEHPIFAIGTEDDGTIQFERKYGSFCHTFSPYWVESLISNLKAAVEFCGYKRGR